MAFTVTDINSRFVSKGPIHKLLNNFAASFDSTDDWKPTDGLQTGRRSRIQPCPGYILCITCPRHLYELSFEPSKTNVEFKVLNFSCDLNLLRLFLYFKAVSLSVTELGTYTYLDRKNHSSELEER